MDELGLGSNAIQTGLFFDSYGHIAIQLERSP
jgi:hypothetical protein